MPQRYKKNPTFANLCGIFFDFIGQLIGYPRNKEPDTGNSKGETKPQVETGKKLHGKKRDLSLPCLNIERDMVFFGNGDIYETGFR